MKFDRPFIWFSLLFCFSIFITGKLSGDAHAEENESAETTNSGLDKTKTPAIRLPKAIRYDLETKTFKKSSPSEADMVLVPAGEFVMGTSDYTMQQFTRAYGISFWDEAPQHRVKLEAFYIDRYEVTNADYHRYMQATSADEPRFWNRQSFNQSEQPVVGVSWEDAQSFAKWAGKRIPTEAEWEKAARWDGEDRTTVRSEYSRIYPWGNTFLRNNLNYNLKYGRPTYVGTYTSGASPYELFDMAGNVSEWVQDLYSKNFYHTQSKGKKYKANNSEGTKFDKYGRENPNGIEHRVHRGGGWDDWQMKELSVRTTRRLHADPETRSPSIGFRCVISAEEVIRRMAKK